jgi:AcrR family transcriptional regulator
VADRESRKKRLTVRRQEQILAAALDVFSQKGYTAATIPEIARTAGLAAGTIYLYFPAKRELFIKTIENLLVTPLLSIFEDETSQNFPTTLKAALDNRMTFFQSDTLSQMMLMMSEIQRDAELRTYFSQTVLQPLFKRMSRVYGAQIDSGLFRPMDPEILARLFGGMMIGMSILKNVEGESSPFNKLTKDQIAQEIINLLLYGILNRLEKT